MKTSQGYLAKKRVQDVRTNAGRSVIRLWRGPGERQLESGLRW